MIEKSLEFESEAFLVTSFLISWVWYRNRNQIFQSESPRPKETGDAV